MSAKPTLWERYQQVFEQDERCAAMDVAALIEAWSQAWFLPEEVAGWLAQGIIHPGEACPRRAQGEKPDIARSKK